VGAVLDVRMSEAVDRGNRAWSDVTDALRALLTEPLRGSLMGSLRYRLFASSEAVEAGTPRVSKLVMVAARAEKLPSAEPLSKMLKTAA
jgi:hypothetical protein